MRTYACVLLHELKDLLEKATDCLVVSEGCLYIVGTYIFVCYIHNVHIRRHLISALKSLYLVFFSVLSGASCLVLTPPTW